MHACLHMVFTAPATKASGLIGGPFTLPRSPAQLPLPGQGTHPKGCRLSSCPATCGSAGQSAFLNALLQAMHTCAACSRAGLIQGHGAGLAACTCLHHGEAVAPAELLEGRPVHMHHSGFQCITHTRRNCAGTCMWCCHRVALLQTGSSCPAKPSPSAASVFTFLLVAAGGPQLLRGRPAHAALA